jgi:hypothetical protein
MEYKGSAHEQKSDRDPESTTQDHKDAMTAGRTQTRAVRAYLEALNDNAPKRASKRRIERAQRHLAETIKEIVQAKTLRRLDLVQRRLDRQEVTARMENAVDPTSLEPGFIAAAKGYSESKGISYEAWRAMDVPARVLKAAGITEAGRS